MIVGFDIDDTITQHPKFFSLISHALLNEGHKVIIITFRDERQIAENDLKQWNIAYNKLITSTLEGCFEYGVNKWKAEMCRQNNVDIYFDDDPRVIKYIDDSTFCIMPIGGCCQKNHNKIALNNCAEQNLEQFLGRVLGFGGLLSRKRK